MDLRKRFDKWLYREFTHDYYLYDKNFKAPDWRKFKVSECPDLVQLEKRLAFYGLKDPWIRNEAWRFHPSMGTAWKNVRMLLFRGTKTGFVLGLSYYLIESTFFPDEHHHH